MDVFGSFLFDKFYFLCLLFYAFMVQRDFWYTVDSIIDLLQVWWKPNMSYDKAESHRRFFCVCIWSSMNFCCRKVWFYCNYYESLDQAVTTLNDIDQIEIKKYFIVLWQIVPCRQKHVNWCGPPIWFRNQISRRWVNICLALAEWVNEFSHWSRYKSKHITTVYYRWKHDGLYKYVFFSSS